MGFVFSSADPFTGIDLDGCVDPATGEVAVWAMEIVQYFDSYTELSASGTGIHIIVKGEMPNAGRTRSRSIPRKGFSP